MVSFSAIIEETLRGALSVYLEYWWFFSFYILWPIFQSLWVVYVQEKYIRGLKWNLLEIKVPAGGEIRPKTMEEFFAALASNYDTAIDTLYDVYLGGVVDSWFSFEIVSFEGDIHFCIRTISMHRDMIESLIYAQYPDAEITEIDEYVTNVPDDIPNAEWDIWGTDIMLAKDQAYPIRTYREFEDQASGEFVDPLANIVEGVNKLGPSEQVWIQILLRPASSEWKAAAKNVVLKLAGRAIKKPEPGLTAKITGEVMDIAKGVAYGVVGAEPPAPKSEEKSDMPSMMLHLSSGEKAIMDAVDMKMTKAGFETDIRYIYAAKRNVFNKGKANSAFFAYFSGQFGNDLANGFKPDSSTKTSAYYFFPDARKKIKKQAILWKYKNRILDVHSYVMTSDELATIFHLPTKEVRGPIVPKVEAKKGKPPATLPV